MGLFNRSLLGIAAGVALVSGCNTAALSSAAPDPADVTAATVACVADTGTSMFDLQCTLAEPDVERLFFVTLPPDHSTAMSWATVFNFHGFSSSAAQQSEFSDFPDKARREGFVLITPMGAGFSLGEGTGFGAWNAGACCSTVDDMSFVRDMLRVAADRFAADPKRIYSTGLSNGGLMSYRLACELADRFAAIASVAAVDETTSCRPSEPVAVLDFHGTLDPLVPYNGGDSPVNEANPLLHLDWHSVTDTVESWVAHDGCSDTTDVTYQQGEVTCISHRDCEGTTAVEHCRVEGGGHTWPGGNIDGAILGHTTEDINATDYIWNFFTNHPKP